MPVKIIAFGPMGENSGKEDVKSLLNYLSGENPKRIFTALFQGTDTISPALADAYPMIPLVDVQCSSSPSADLEGSSEMQIKMKVLELGLETVSSYVQSNSLDMDSLNSEITNSLYRAFFLFYSAAMKREYELLFEDRRMCSYGKLTENGATDGDILIVPPWDAYWFYDRLGS